MTLQQSLQLSFVLQNSPMAPGRRDGDRAMPTTAPGSAASLEERYARRGRRAITFRWRSLPA